MPSPGERAERLALAVIMGEVTMADVREDLGMALRERETAADVAALTDYRQGAPVWVWPGTAPWAGF